ncbi:MAG: DUF6325 family protein [Gaiellaceae bacterium]
MTVGPVQLLVLGMEGTEPQPELRAELDRLRNSDTVRLIDLLVVRKDGDGKTTFEQRSDLTADEATEVGALAGALLGLGLGEGDEDAALALAGAGAEAGSDGHLIDEDTVWYLEDAIPADSSAAIALVEHRWAIPLRDAMREADVSLLSDAWIHPADLVGIGLLAAGEAATA